MKGLQKQTDFPRALAAENCECHANTTVTLRKVLANCIKRFLYCSQNSAHRIVTVDPQRLLTEQAESWKQFWDSGCVRLRLRSDETSSSSSGVRLPTIIVAAQYSLLTCFPTPVHVEDSADDEKCSFYGLCPTGLSRGDEEDDYMGHVFWDMELWMLPWVSVFHPDLHRLALDYRYAMLPAARYQAIMCGLDGARFPWESAFTGMETTPWNLAADHQLHITGDVSFAAQQWILTHAQLPKSGTVDSPEPVFTKWHTQRGRILLEEVARFWRSRMRYSEEKKAFEILGVMPPDEYVHCCNNSAYTNAIASLSLRAPALLARRFRITPIPPEYEEWEKSGAQLWMPRDSTNQVMLEHEGYTLGTPVKQADTILLSYPLLYSLPDQWKRNAIDHYARVTDPQGPAMTWSIYCICALELKLFDEAVDYFERSLLHVQPPYWTWTETRSGDGATNFLTGAGGFLQSLVNGFAGLRIQVTTPGKFNPDWSSSTDVIPTLYLNPTIPDQFRSIWHSLCLNRVHFQARDLNITLDVTLNQLTLSLIAGAPLVVGHQAASIWKLDLELNPDASHLSIPFQPVCLISCEDLSGIRI